MRPTAHCCAAGASGCTRRIAAALEDRFPEIVLAQPALLAQHCAAAGLAEQAVAYWLKAGQQALARSAMAEAVAQLRKGLDVLAGLPDGPWRQQQELDLQIALGSALTATKGWSAAEVGETLARARALAEQLDRPEYLVPLIVGQWAFHFVRAEHRLALSLGEQLEKIGEARNDAAAQLLGRFMHGVTRFYLGEFVAARALLERCMGLADPAHRTIARAVLRSLRCDARVPRPDPGVPGLHRSGTVADGRSVVGGPPAQTRPYAGSRAPVLRIGLDWLTVLA